jgi:putative FmdB family regulatory protein
MPIYEYRCKECHQLFEKWRKQVEDESVVHNCPICKGSAERLISHTTFALKGGGWYVTEYGSKKNELASEGKSSEKSCTPSAAASCGKAPGAGESSAPVGEAAAASCKSCTADCASGVAS